MEQTLTQTGIVFGIQPFSLDDGPGIRTTVFLKGCNANCLWCHNPESISCRPSVRYLAAKCTGCGRCAQVCPAGCHQVGAGSHRFDRAACRSCFACTTQCPSGALLQVGQEQTVGDVLQAVLADRAYYAHTGGGMTVSGGEPMMQPRFTRALLQAAHAEGVHTALETNGSFSGERYAPLVGSLDLVLLDYKATGAERSLALTGIDESCVRETLRQLTQAGVPVVVRCPIIPGLNDQPEHFEAIARLSVLPGVLGFELMPYHNLGVAKAAQVGLQMEEYHRPSEEEKKQMEQAVLRHHGHRWEGSV